MLCSKLPIENENCMLLTLFTSEQPTGYVSNVDPKQIDGLDDYFNNLSLGISQSSPALESNTSVNNKSTVSTTSSISSLVGVNQSIRACNLPQIEARDIVLKRCNQTEPYSFDYFYSSSELQKCHKIGEGVYGEVFLLKNSNGQTSVLKIIPIEGNILVNGEHQKKFDEILSEIIITQELSALRKNDRINQTNCYTHVTAVRCVQGKYPERLIELWELYDEDKGSENDHPSIFPDDQLYIVLELEHGGRDLESYEFLNAEQAYNIFVQTAYALAVGENALKFEHRDLHWGNLLIKPIEQQTMDFFLNGKMFTVSTSNVKATIIDFTLSRVTYNDVCIYNNLAEDPDLFKSHGDYQFEVYKLMQRQNKNEWEHFEPYSNILWLHYIILKMIKGARYKKTRSLKHSNYLQLMEQISSNLLTYSSAVEFVQSMEQTSI